MANRRSRRDLICEAALDLAAEGGNHALTHQAIDARLGLARGSTSYYYRTREALVSAAITRLTHRSREYFDDAVQVAPPLTIESAGSLIADQLETLLLDRRRDVLARYALIFDAAGDGELRSGLASCLFSQAEATALMEALGAEAPVAAARDLISLLEGLIFDGVIRSSAVDAYSIPAGWRESMRTAIILWLGALAARG